MKQRLLLMVLALGMFGINVSAQIKKQSTAKRTTTAHSTNTQQGGQIMKFRQVSRDGYIWYRLKRGNLLGACDADGNNIIPIKYDDVTYFCEEGKNYFIVNSNGSQGVYSIEGDYIIKTDKGYREIELWVNNIGTAAIWFAAKARYRDIDVYDTHGKFVVHGWHAFLNKSDEMLAFELYYDVKDNTAYRTYYGFNFGPEFIFAPNTSIYKGVPSSSTSSSSSSSSPNNNNSGNRTTVVVEHPRDLAPVQEWQACFGCGGMGTMGCDNCGGSGTKYIGDRLHRCSRCNGRGIIPCNVCYGNKGQYVTVYK